MANNYKADALKSKRDFELFGRDALKRYFNTDLVFTTEGHETEFATALDRMHGVDALVVDSCGKIHGVSCRFQRDHDYSAFSRRRTRTSGTMTEHDKDIKASKAGLVTADYALQGFILDGGRKAILGIAPMCDIRTYTLNNPDQWHKNKNDGSTFFSIPFRAVGAVVYREELPF